MGAGATEWAWQHSRASNGALLVLLAIADECNEGMAVEMSQARLAHKARLTDRGVRNALRDLAALGELAVEPRPGGRSRYALCPADSGKNFRGTPEKSSAPEKSSGVPTPEKSSGVTDSAEIKPQVSGTPEKSAGVKISDVLKSTTTGRSVVKVKDASEVAPEGVERPDVDRLCDHLAARILANGNRPPRITKKWRDAARLLIDKDGMTEKQVHDAIDWSQDSEFWRANILSMPKLREQYDTLRQQARRKPPQQKSTTADRVRQAVDAGKRVQAMLNGGP